MSWIGGISSITGQISNFTKEVLSEGREEVSDHATELTIAIQQAKELEVLCTAQKQEIERLHAINRELEERTQSAELQINTISKEYRTLLKQKEGEIKNLKEKHQDLQELHEKIVSTSCTYIPSSNTSGGPSVFPAAVEDFDDVISSQHEINQLRNTVHRLQVERDRWKRQALAATQQKQQDDNNKSEDVSISENVQVLQYKIKTLEQQLLHQIDEHHCELAALQDAHREKLVQCKLQYEQQITALQQLNEGNNPDGESTENIKGVICIPAKPEATVVSQEVLNKAEETVREKNRTLHLLGRQMEKLTVEKAEVDQQLAVLMKENATIQNNLKKLTDENATIKEDDVKYQNIIRDQEALINKLKAQENLDVTDLKNKLEVAETKIAELVLEKDQISNDLCATKHKLLTQLDSSHASSKEILVEVQETRRKFNSTLEQRQGFLLQEKQDLVKRMVHTNEKEKDLQENVKSIEVEQTMASLETEEMIQALGDPEHQELVAGMIHALELENKVLKQQNSALESKIHVLQQKHFSDDQSLSVSNSNSGRFNNKVEDFLRDRSDSEKTILENDLDIESENPKDSRYSRTSTPFLRKARSSSNVSDRSDTGYQQLLTELEECETSSLTSSYSELSLRNKELDDQVRTLQTQIDGYERDIEHFEMVKSDWQIERCALEEILTKLRTQLRDKEASLSLVTAQKGLLEVKKQSPRVSKDKEKEDDSSELEEELKILQEQIEELTQGSAQLENERDVLKIEKEKVLEELHRITKQNKKLQDKLTSIEKEAVEANKTDDLKEQDVLQQKINDLEEKMNNLQVEKNILLSSLEELDLQHQQAIDQILESRNSLQTNLQEAQKENEFLNHQLENQKKEMQSLTSAQLSELEELKLKYAETKKSQQLLDDKVYGELNKAQKLLEKLEFDNIKPLDMSSQLKDKKCDEAKAIIGTIENLVQGITEMDSMIKEMKGERIDLEKKVEEACLARDELDKELNLATQTVANLQTELNQIKDERTRSLWEVDSWEDIGEEAEKNGKDTLLKTKLQDLELESTSSKQSKESSDDGQEKYGELVQRKEDLEIQIKEFENQLITYQDEKEKLINDIQQLKEQNYSEQLSIAAKKLDKSSETTDKVPSLPWNDESSVNEIKLKVQKLLQKISDLKQEMENNSSFQEKVFVLLMEIEQETLNLCDEKLFSRSEPNNEIRPESNISNISEFTMSSNSEVYSLQSKSHELNSDSLKDIKHEFMDSNDNEKGSSGLILSDTKQDILKKELHLCEEKIKEYEKLLLELKQQNETNLQKITELHENSLVEQDLISQLRSEVDDKDRQLSALNNILKVYKENLDPEITEKSTISKKEDRCTEDTSVKDVDEKEMADAEINKAGKLQEALRFVEEQPNNASYSEGQINSFEKQIKTLQKEKEQLISVISEKSRENSFLKGEVHRLMNFVSAEKTALNKLQQDNRELLQKRENFSVENSEMSKEAFQNLARIIQDKDIEIEALQQKNHTLLAVLQQSSPEGTHLQSLLQERENLIKQLGLYQAEREQIISALTQKHQESITYHAEIQRLTGILSAESQKLDTLQQEHSTIAKQYEEKQKVLINTQNDMILLKQRVTELEEQQMDIKTKYVELLHKDDKDKTDDEVLVEISSGELKAKNEKLDLLNQALQEKDKWLFDKDKLLHEQAQQLQNLQEIYRRKEEEIVALKRQIDSLTLQLNSFQTELENSKEKCEIVNNRFDDVNAKANVLQESNSKLSMTVQEKDFEIKALREKVETLSTLVQQHDTSSDEMKKFLLESESMQLKAQEFQQERDQVMVALSNSQRENKELQNELHVGREREKWLQRELERLRTHLIQVEESYTREALHAEEREKELRNRLALAEERARNVSSSYTTASQHASLQLESLQEQLHTVSQQRDDARSKLNENEKQIQQYISSLQTLQLVLEQFQQEKEREMSLIQIKCDKRVSEETKKVKQLEEEIRKLEGKLIEAAEALDAASRLSEKLDEKEEVISSLKKEVTDLEKSLRKSSDEINKITTTNEGKVDRNIIKNLIVGYFNTPHNKQTEVLRIIATVLDFNYEERIKSGLENTHSGWMSGWLRKSPAKQSAVVKPKIPSLNQSLSEAFVKFLENESQPRLPAVKLPMEPVTRKSEHKPVNPFAMIPNVASPSRHTKEPDAFHLLMKPMAATLPTFTPVVVTDSNSTANNILREVLKQE